MEQPPGPQVVVVAVLGQLPAEMAGEDLEAARLDRDPAVLADRLRRRRERSAERLDLLGLLRGQLAQLVERRDRRVQRVPVDPQRAREDRVQDEEHRDAARERDQVRGDADRLVADLRQHDVGPDVVEDPLERAEVVDRPADAPRLRVPGAGPVVAVDVPQVRDRVERLDPLHLVVERARLADLRCDVGEAACVRSLLAQQPGRLAGGRHVRDLVPATLELAADDAVELALVGHQGGQQEAHLGLVEPSRPTRRLPARGRRCRGRGRSRPR